MGGGVVGGRRPVVGLYLLVSSFILFVVVDRCHVAQSAVSYCQLSTVISGPCSYRYLGHY